MCLQCVFNHDGSKFAAVRGDRIYIFNCRDTIQKMDLRGPHEQVSTFHYSCVCGNVGVSMNSDVRNWVLFIFYITHLKVSMTCLYIVRTLQVLSVTWSDDDARLVSCGTEGGICMWNALTGTCESKIEDTTCTFTDVIFMPNNGHVVAVSSDNKLKEFKDDLVS